MRGAGAARADAPSASSSSGSGSSSVLSSNITADPSAAAPPLRRLRVRWGGGVAGLEEGLTAQSTLADLCAACAAAAGGSLATLSFRGDDMTVVHVLRDGAFPAGGALLLGPDTPLAMVGVADQTLFNASLAASGGAAAKAGKA
ncbi:MAG: hypothetical protein AAFU61_18565, partial [Pseudomonadota bacterium]